MAKLTVADLLAEKETRTRQETALVSLPGLGGELEIRRIPLARYMSYTSQLDADDPSGLVSAQCDLIYACCPTLHDERLREAYDCKEPSEVVMKVLDENLNDMNLLVTAISKFYGIDLGADLKN